MHTCKKLTGNKALLLSTLLACGGASADGLADLKGALVRLQATSPMHLAVDIVSTQTSGEAKNAKQKNGHANLELNEDNHGLLVRYAKSMLVQLETEKHARELDEHAPTPAAWALEQAGFTDLHNMVAAAAALEKSIGEAGFRTETATSYEGKPARQLSFDIPVTSVPEKDREYIKKFTGTLDVWIAEDGTPLASRSKQVAEGRAFLVISFQISNDDHAIYTVVDGHLLASRLESQFSSAGMGDVDRNNVVKTLGPQGAAWSKL